VEAEGSCLKRSPGRTSGGQNTSLLYHSLVGINFRRIEVLNPLLAIKLQNSGEYLNNVWAGVVFTS
jgi:hypothetical protein